MVPVLGLFPRDAPRWRAQRVLVALILTLADVPWLLTIHHGNLRGPPQCHVYPQEIAGLIKGLLTIRFPWIC